MTEDLGAKKSVNLDSDQPIDLSKSSRVLFQERIRRENQRPVPQLIPLRLLPPFSFERHPFQAAEHEAKPGRVENDRRETEMKITVRPNKNRLARVRSCPYLPERRRLTAAQKSKSDSRISVTSTVGSAGSAGSGSSQVPTCSVNSSSDRFSQLFISKVRSHSLGQGLTITLEDHGQRGGSSLSKDYPFSTQDATLRPGSFGANARNGAGVSPSTLKSLRNFLQRKQQNHQISDTSGTGFNAS